MNLDFEDKLKEVIKACGDNVDISSINDDTDLVRDFGFDSINIVQLVVEMESTFDIEVDDDDLMLEKLSLYRGLIEILKVKFRE